MVICEQVLEHVVDPCAAAANLRRLCAAGGHVIVSTPFLVKVHELPMYAMNDYWRFTPRGLQTPSSSGRPRSGHRGLVGQPGPAWSATSTAGPRTGPWHSLRNEPDLPLQVWAFATNPG